MVSAAHHGYAGHPHSSFGGGERSGLRKLVAALAVVGAGPWGCTRDFAGTAGSEPKIQPSTSAAAQAVPPVQIVRRTYRAMGTQIGFQAWTEAPERAVGAFEAAILEFRRLEALHSNWLPQSDISRMNDQAGGRAVTVSEETVELLLAAQEMYALTAGKFDIGFGALSDLWRFDHDQDNRIPSQDEVRARLPLVDASRIEVERTRLQARLPVEGMRIHVGGIGKGYAVDRAAAVLRARGFRDFVVQAGGDLYASGRRGDRSWRVGIRDPRGPPSRYFAFAEIENQTLSTSGDYERFFISDGVRYHHIIDPDTGQPARKLRSVSVLAPTAVLADALSTGVFILGVHAGLELIEAQPGVAAVLVDAQNRVHVSKRLSGKVRLVDSPTP